MKKYATYCGLYCGACSSMLKREQEEGLLSVNDVIVDAEESSCAGCSSEGLESCSFIRCNNEHATESCAFCLEFPCTKIKEFSADKWEHHRVVLNNLKRIKEIGMEPWLEEQSMFWQCKDCGTRIMWYQENCTKCGKVIENRFF